MKYGKTLNMAWRLPCALIVASITAFVFMRIAGGATMFCMDPPGGTPGREWKVPLAWAIIYGTSTFLGVMAGALRSKEIVTPIVVCIVMMGMFITLRHLIHSAAQRSYMTEEAMFGIPSMILTGAIACIVIIVLARRARQ